MSQQTDEAAEALKVVLSDRDSAFAAMQKTDTGLAMMRALLLIIRTSDKDFDQKFDEYSRIIFEVGFTAGVRSLVKQAQEIAKEKANG